MMGALSNGDSECAALFCGGYRPAIEIAPTITQSRPPSAGFESAQADFVWCLPRTPAGPEGSGINATHSAAECPLLPWEKGWG